MDPEDIDTVYQKIATLCRDLMSERGRFERWLTP